MLALLPTSYYIINYLKITFWIKMFTHVDNPMISGGIFIVLNITNLIFNWWIFLSVFVLVCFQFYHFTQFLCFAYWFSIHVYVSGVRKTSYLLRIMESAQPSSWALANATSRQLVDSFCLAWLDSYSSSIALPRTSKENHLLSKMQLSLSFSDVICPFPAIFAPEILLSALFTSCCKSVEGRIEII